MRFFFPGGKCQKSPARGNDLWGGRAMGCDFTAPGVRATSEGYARKFKSGGDADGTAPVPTAQSLHRR